MSLRRGARTRNYLYLAASVARSTPELDSDVVFYRGRPPGLPSSGVVGFTRSVASGMWHLLLERPPLTALGQRTPGPAP